MSLKTRKVDKALVNKGFIKENKHHIYYRLVVNKIITPIFTKLSHSHSEINKRLINRISTQLKMEKNEFIDYVDCKYEYDEYVKKLSKKGYI
ncbi:MAG: type II toxin-antitoxin system HicA family toxin [Candidatus Helarchaeota archaeon]